MRRILGELVREVLVVRVNENLGTQQHWSELLHDLHNAEQFLLDRPVVLLRRVKLPCAERDVSFHLLVWVVLIRVFLEDPAAKLAVACVRLDDKGLCQISKSFVMPLNVFSINS